MNLIDLSEIHCHTEFSSFRLVDSCIKLEDAIQYAFDLGLKGVCITDHECISGHIRAINKHKQILKDNPNSDFKVMLGNEIYLIDSLEKEEKKKYHHFLLIAKDDIGHRYLRELSSTAWKQSFYDRRLERVPTLYSDVEKIIKEKGHMIASTACLGSKFSELVLTYIQSGDKKYTYLIDDFINWCINIFGKEDFYIEIQPGTTQEQIEYNKKAIQIANFYKLKYVVTNDVHYLNKADSKIHEAYLKSKQEERETTDFYENCYFKTSEEIIERMQYLNKDDIEFAINNTIEITNKVDFFDLSQEVEVPELDLNSFKLKHLFNDWYDKYENIKFYAYSEFDQDRFLLHQIEQGFLDLNEEFNDENLSRIDVELYHMKEISAKLNKRLGSYYTLVQKLVDIMWDDTLGNSIVEPGRGSAAGFYISYLLKIVQIKPMEYDLPFWRHIHETKVELSDIDIDTESSKRQGIFKAFKTVFGEDNVINICTFKTEGTKSAILTSCRGLGIDNDIADEIASYIPIERGKQWSINDCLYGNEEKNRKPIKELLNKMSEFPLLIETVKKIEGLICGRSIHASGVFIFKNGFIEQNSLMKAPNGEYVTAFDMNDSLTTGCLKIDCLTIEAADKKRKTLELLLEDGLIEWKGSLRKTYDFYIHPNTLEYDNEKIWDLLCNGEINDIFQFDSSVGKQAINAVKPRSVIEMMSTNAIMRLQPEAGKENPIERYVRFKNDNTAWKREMIQYGLSNEEINILNKYLYKSYGSCSEQEDLMELSMAKEISAFTFPESNDFKSGVAKKKEDKIVKAKKIFYKKGQKNGCREIFLDYVWEICFKPQFGYAFSKCHDAPYSVIGLQEMNLFYKHGRLYWDCACLSVNAGADEENETRESTNYGKIAKVIGNMKSQGVKIDLPRINKAKFGFSVDAISDSIVFGLKGISNIGDEIAFAVIKNKKDNLYKSLIDFIQRTNLPKVANINLIKGGCFDELENKPRVEIMQDYLQHVASTEHEMKTSLNMQDLAKIEELNLLTQEDKIYIRFYNFNKYITRPQFIYSKEGRKTLLIAKDNAFDFFGEYYVPHMKEQKDYIYAPEGMVFNKKAYNKIYKKRMEEFSDKLNNNYVQKYNELILSNNIQNNYQKYCKGTISKWEMDALSFYYTSHELSNVDKEKYNISDFSNLPEEPEIEGVFNYKGRKFPRYKLCKIMGTILDKDRIRHTISLLTTEGVVDIKFYAEQYIYYTKNISKANEKGKKQVIEKSWFSRGNKVVVTGFRRGDRFIPRKYKDSIYNHTICLIEDVINDGKDLELKLERERV